MWKCHVLDGIHCLGNACPYFKYNWIEKRNVCSVTNVISFNELSNHIYNLQNYELQNSINFPIKEK